MDGINQLIRNDQTGTVQKIRLRIANEILAADEIGEPVDIQTAAERALNRSLAEADELGWPDRIKTAMTLGYAAVAADMLAEAIERVARKHPFSDLGRAWRANR